MRKGLSSRQPDGECRRAVLATGAPEVYTEAISCDVTARRFNSLLIQRKPVRVYCPSSCANVGETDLGWQVYGFGPFRDDSCICKAAFTAGVKPAHSVLSANTCSLGLADVAVGGTCIDLQGCNVAGVIGHKGGVCTLIFASRVIPHPYVVAACIWMRTDGVHLSTACLESGMAIKHHQ